MLDELNKLLDNAAEAIAQDEQIMECQRQLAALHGIEIKVKKTTLKAKVLKKIADIINNDNTDMEIEKRRFFA